MNRRRFLAGALAAGSGLLLPRHLLAQTPPAEPNYFALLSDVHISEQRDLGVLKGGNSAERLEQAIVAILALPSRPAGVIVAGDCAYLQGKPGDYAMLGELIKPLRQAGVPIHFALGNHDVREQFLAAFPEAKAQAAVEPTAFNKFVTIVETPHANWFLLDSLDQTNTKTGLGQLGEAQLAWLAKALDARPNKPALLLAHHNPHPAPLLKNSCLTDTEAFFKVIMPRKQVKAYFHGHTHQWGLDRHLGVHLVNLPSVVCGLDPTQPYGFVTARLRSDGASLVLLLHALGRKHSKYGEKIDLEWRT